MKNNLRNSKVRASRVARSAPEVARDSKRRVRKAFTLLTRSVLSSFFSFSLFVPLLFSLLFFSLLIDRLDRGESRVPFRRVSDTRAK